MYTSIKSCCIPETTDNIVLVIELYFNFKNWPTLPDIKTYYKIK